MKKELFICDSCGARTRLNNAQRHWCGVCNQGSPVEMRYAKNKKPLILDGVADDIMQEGCRSPVCSERVPGTRFRPARDRV